MKKLRPLKVISELSEEGLEKVFVAVERYTYQKAQKVLAEPEEKGGVGKVISEKSLRNYRARYSGALLVAERPGLAKRAKGWLEYAATGDAAQFDEAAVEVIKQRTFELAESMKDEEELGQLRALFGILCQVRLTKVRERTVAVREGNLKLRAREGEVRENKVQTQVQMLRGKIRREEREEGKELEEDQEKAVRVRRQEEDPVARVIQHCGSVAHFFKKMLPGERIMHAVKRLDQEIAAGRLPWRPWDDEDEPLTENGRTGVFVMSPEDEEWVRKLKEERERKAGKASTEDGSNGNGSEPECATECMGGEGI